MKILKFTRRKDAVQFKHEVQGHEAVEERDHTCHEAPLQSLDDALQALAAVACNILEVGAPYSEGLVVVGVSISHTKKGTRSASIVFTKKLDATGTAHRMDTPVFQFDDPAEGEEGERRQCAKRHAELLVEFLSEAEKYASGERQQQLLPLGDGKEAGGGEEDDGKVENLPGLGAPGGEDGPPEREGGVDKPRRGRKPRGAK